MILQQSQPLYKQVYTQIKKSILSGDIRPGSKMVLSELAKEFEISRTPLREALRQLEKEGLLIQKSNGPRVVSLNERDFKELCYCRLILEKEMINLVIDEITDNQINQVLELIKKTEVTTQQGNNLETLHLNTEFHSLLIHACSNKRLIQILEQVRSMLLIYRAEINKVDADNLEILQEHKMILEAITQKDKEKAREVIEMHLNNDQRRGEKIFTER